MNLFTLIGLIAWAWLGALVTSIMAGRAQAAKAARVIRDAESEGRDILSRAEQTADTLRKEIDEARADIRDRKNDAIEQERRIAEKEKKVDQKYEELESKRTDLRNKEELLETKIAEVDKKSQTIESRLEEVAKLSQVDAKELLMQYTEERYEKDILSLIEKKRKDLKVREEELTREILIKSIQQYAWEVTGETTQTMVQLESDDLKGKIIGKEGRNIIAFEKATGVSLIIDDAPDTVFLSSFDLFRRYIAKKSLEDLIADKRIQPARIEEIVEKNQQDADKLIYDLGRKTIDEMGVIGIPDEIVPLIGKFRFRTSYGQNILMHSKEVA